MDVDGKLSLVIQRKIDYIYGGSFATKLAHAGKQNITNKMKESGIEGSLQSCPVEPMKKDYIASFMAKLLGLGVIMIVVGFFTSPETTATLYTVNSYIMITLVVLIISFYFVGLHDSKKYNSCTSCQIGNLLGTMARFSIFTLILFIASRLALT